MATQTYDCYVRLAYIVRDEGIVVKSPRYIPMAKAYRRDDPNFPNGWQDLVTTGTLAIWLVERTQVTHAADMVLAHLAGHAPVGVTKLYDVKEKTNEALNAP
jgi:hypothetical protein